jgi:hypothetical protein
LVLSSSESPIHAFSIAGLDDDEDQLFPPGAIEDPVVSNADTKDILVSGQFAAALWERFICELEDGLYNALLIIPR